MRIDPRITVEYPGGRHAKRISNSLCYKEVALRVLEKLVEFKDVRVVQAFENCDFAQQLLAVLFF